MTRLMIGLSGTLMVLGVVFAVIAAVIGTRNDEPLYCGIDFVIPQAGDLTEQEAGEQEESKPDVVISDSLTLKPIQVQNARLVIGIGQALGQPVEAIHAAVNKSLTDSEFLNVAPDGLMGLNPILAVDVDVLDKAQAITYFYRLLPSPPPSPDTTSQWHIEVSAILDAWLISTNPTECEPGNFIGGELSEDDVVRIQGITVHRSIASQLNELLLAAQADGIVLTGWGWRSHQRQHELRQINGCPNDGSWVHTPGEDPRMWEPASSCRVPTARPGFSNHESGLAVDFRYRGSTITSRRSPAFRWLAANASRYGFYNLPSEPWHWSVDGR